MRHLNGNRTMSSRHGNDLPPRPKTSHDFRRKPRQGNERASQTSRRSEAPATRSSWNSHGRSKKDGWGGRQQRAIQLSSVSEEGEEEQDGERSDEESDRLSMQEKDHGMGAPRTSEEEKDDGEDEDEDSDVEQGTSLSKMTPFR